MDAGFCGGDDGPCNSRVVCMVVTGPLLLPTHV